MFFVHDRTPPWVSQIRDLSLQARDPSRDVEEYFSRETDIERRPSLSRARLIDRVFSELLGAAPEDLCGLKEDVAFRGRGEVAPRGEGSLGCCYGREGVANIGGGGAVDEGVCGGGVDVEG